MRVYFDSCIAIYLVERGEPWFSAIRQVHLPRLAEPGSSVIFTDLNRLECRTLPLALGRGDILREFDDFFARSGMQWTPLQTEVFDLATELRARHRVKTPDALHLAAAMMGGCDEFWTNDRRLEQAAGGRLSIVVPNNQA